MRNVENIFIGASGFIGKYLTSYFHENNIIKTYFNNPISNGVKIDFTNSNFSTFFNNYPNAKRVFLLGGMTNFAKINKYPDLAYDINVTYTKKLIDEICRRNIKPFFFSSESVFDGIKGNYIETDIAKPCFEYGHFKKEIEDYLISNFNNFIIFRLSKVFDSNFMQNTLVTSWINKLILNQDISCANDNYFSPIHVEDLCKLIIGICNNSKSNGIYHLSSNENLSRKEMLEILLNKISNKHSYKSKITYQSLNLFPNASLQPLNTTLNSIKAINQSNFKPSKYEYWVNNILNQSYYISKFRI